MNDIDWERFWLLMATGLFIAAFWTAVGYGMMLALHVVR